MKDKLEAMPESSKLALSDLMAAREQGPEALRAALLKLNPPRPKKQG